LAAALCSVEIDVTAHRLDDQHLADLRSLASADVRP
jgi:hypothetical protein